MSAAAVRPTSGAVATVLGALRGVTRSGSGWLACCPAHPGEEPVLRVWTEASGRVRLRCPRGCTARRIVTGAGLALSDLDAPLATPVRSIVELAREQETIRTATARAERPVLLCETREVARGLTDEGYTCAWLDTPGGQWGSESAAAFAGIPEVIVLPNGGVRSRVWAEHVAAALGGERAVRIVTLAGMERRDDVLDWLEARGDDALDAFDAAIDGAAVWRPEDGPRPTPTRFAVLSDQELEALPPPTWLWEGLLPAGALGALIGMPGAGKSFVALDLAASIAAGRSPLGRPVLTGSVLYVAAEGTAGLPQRLAAWKHAHGHAGHSIPLHFVTQGVNLFTPGDEAHLIAACRQIARPDAPVRLVILDTLARVMPGGEENSAKDVGLVIEHAERIRRAIGCSVLLVHHTGKASDDARGSSALRGAMDVILLLKTDDPDAAAGVKLLVTDKQKDAAPADPVVFTLEPVAAETVHGRISSCRVSLSAIGWTDAPDEHGPLTRTQLDALRVLRDVFGTVGATATEWMDATGIPKRTFYRARAALERADCILVSHGRGTRVQVTAAGLRTLSHPPTVLGAIGANSMPLKVPGGVHPPPYKGGDATPSPRSSVPRLVPTSRRETPPTWYDRDYLDEEVP